MILLKTNVKQTCLQLLFHLFFESGQPGFTFCESLLFWFQKILPVLQNI